MLIFNVMDVMVEDMDEFLMSIWDGDGDEIEYGDGDVEFGDDGDHGGRLGFGAFKALFLFQQIISQIQSLSTSEV